MPPLLPVVLLLSCVSAFALPPFITPAPQLAVRDAAVNICGYYSLGGITDTISCSIGTPCLVATNLSPAVGYCSDTDNTPLTTAYPYGSWPSEQGCLPGAECCPLETPAVGKYVFNSGSTVFLGCNAIPLTLTALFWTPTRTSSIKNPAPAAVTTTDSLSIPTFTMPSSTTSPLSGFPATSATATRSTAQPSQTSSPSRFSSTTTITIIVVGAVVALVGGIVFLWFLIMAWKIHHKAKYPPPQPAYSPIPYQNSNPSLNYMPPPEKKNALGKWSKVAGIISSIFGVVGLVVSIYFGLKQK